MQRSEATVRLQALDGQWETAGTERLRGITPQAITYSHNIWGSDTASFQLRRDPGGVYPDLTAFTPVEIEVGGVIVWSGRVKETPTRDGDDPVISVQCEGWQYHLDDDVYAKNYVHTNLGDWKDSRSLLNGNLVYHRAFGQVSNDNGIITLMWPANQAPATTADRIGVTLDLGPTLTAKRVVLGWKSSNDSALTLLCRGSDSEDSTVAGNDAFSFALNSAASGTTAGTFTTARRYIHFYIYGATVAPTGDRWIKLTSIQVFGDTAYESGNASILKASDVVKDARNQATLLLSLSDDKIAATSFSIPELALSDPRTPREAMQAVNAYHDYVAMVDVNKRVVFKAKPSAPVIEIGNWSGAEFSDASANSGSDIYNKAVVQAPGPDGTQLSVTRTATARMVNRRGFNRAKILSVSAPLTTAGANQIGDVFLTNHTSTPLRGSIQVTSNEGVRTVLGGQPVAPHLIPLFVNEKIRLAHRVDPDTGAWGRDGTIVSANYNHDAGTATVELDSTRGNFEALLARLALVNGQVK